MACFSYFFPLTLSSRLGLQVVGLQMVYSFLALEITWRELLKVHGFMINLMYIPILKIEISPNFICPIQ